MLLDYHMSLSITVAENASSICSNGDIRLVGGSAPYEGNVEVCFNGRWGNICHDSWGITDAQVVCKLLGYDSEPVLPTRSAFFGQVTDNLIFLDEVQCIGNETSILQCPSVNPGDHDCSHFLDAGVICSGKSTLGITCCICSNKPPFSMLVQFYATCM